MMSVKPRLEESHPVKRSHQQKRKPALELKVVGPHVHTGRIRVPDLLHICHHAQQAVNRQAEALEGRPTTLRPGPKLGKVREECTLELISLGAGSAVLGFDQATDQVMLPGMDHLARQAIQRVGETIRSLGTGGASATQVDAGVLDSLLAMGTLLDNGVRSIRWIVPARPGFRGIDALFSKRARNAIAVRSSHPDVGAVPFEVEGVVEMADFKPNDKRCRIHPATGAPIQAEFDPSLDETVYGVLRRPARVSGSAHVDKTTGRPEAMKITAVTPLDEPIDSGTFASGWSLEQLVRGQAVTPLTDPTILVGGLPDDEDLDTALAAIYQQRQ
jgi:hypothetical protein